MGNAIEMMNNKSFWEFGFIILLPSQMMFFYIAMLVCTMMIRHININITTFKFASAFPAWMFFSHRISVAFTAYLCRWLHEFIALGAWYFLGFSKTFGAICVIASFAVQRTIMSCTSFTIVFFATLNTNLHAHNLIIPQGIGKVNDWSVAYE